MTLNCRFCADDTCVFLSKQKAEKNQFSPHTPNTATHQITPKLNYIICGTHIARNCPWITYFLWLFSCIRDRCVSFYRSKYSSWGIMFRQCQLQCPMSYVIYPNSWCCCFFVLRTMFRSRAAIDFRQYDEWQNKQIEPKEMSSRRTESNQNFFAKKWNERKKLNSHVISTHTHTTNCEE